MKLLDPSDRLRRQLEKLNIMTVRFFETVITLH